MNKRLRSKMEELAKGYSHRSDELVEDGYMTRPEMFTEGFKAAIDLVEASVKDLYDDEYVQQVGTWKIIQRLEEQLKSSEEALEDLTEVWHLKMNDYKNMTAENYELYDKLKTAVAREAELKKENKALIEKVIAMVPDDI